jgi:hypothetical protein
MKMDKDEGEGKDKGGSRRRFICKFPQVGSTPDPK